MPNTVDTLGEIKRDQIENSCLLFANVSPNLYMLIQLFSSISVNSVFQNIHLGPCFACRLIFCHYSPRFQRIIVNYTRVFASSFYFENVIVINLSIKSYRDFIGFNGEPLLEQATSWLVVPPASFSFYWAPELYKRLSCTSQRIRASPC